MLRLFSFFLLMMGVFPLAAQTAQKGDITIGIHGGPGIYNVYDNISLREKTIANAACLYVAMEGKYFIKERISFGLGFGHHGYVTEDDSTSVIKTAVSNDLFLNGDYYYSNRKKFNAYLGFRAGVTGFHFSRIVFDLLTVNTGDVYASGAHFGLRTGFNWYFLKFLGFNMDLGYTAYPLRWQEFLINGEERDLYQYKPVKDMLLTIRGIELKAGFTVRF